MRVIAVRRPSHSGPQLKLAVSGPTVSKMSTGLHQEEHRNYISSRTTKKSNQVSKDFPFFSNRGHALSISTSQLRMEQHDVTGAEEPGKRDTGMQRHRGGRGKQPEEGTSVRLSIPF